MTNENRSELYDIICDTVDYLRDGFARSRKPLAAQRAPARAGTGTVSADGAVDSVSEVEAVSREVLSCTRCGLSRTRTHGVPGEGVLNPDVVLIGEGPGADEDRTGRPFVGAAGQYLDKWLEAIGLDRGTNCYIANIVKCRPPNNRDPRPEESEACIPYLERQIDALKPRAILTLGRIAVQNLLQTTRGIGALRGSTYSYRGVPVIPTYHPSGVLRNPEYRKPVWEDLQRLQSLLSEGGREIAGERDE